jgi:hypothetical protein
VTKTSLAEIESSVYSQNGEDGILEYLSGEQKTGTIVEMGAGGGHKNNSRRLLEAGWTGALFENEKRRVEKLKRRWPRCAIAETVSESTSPRFWYPDVFSLDIDSYDFWIAASLLKRGFRPRIAVLEYNAAIDPSSATVPLDAKCEPRFIYFGCSLAAWKKLWSAYGYRFVTVCSAGINAFFVDDSVPQSRLDAVEWLAWADCESIARRFGSHEERHALLAGRDLVIVE